MAIFRQQLNKWKVITESGVGVEEISNLYVYENIASFLQAI